MLPQGPSIVRGVASNVRARGRDWRAGWPTSRETGLLLGGTAGIAIGFGLAGGAVATGLGLLAVAAALVSFRFPYLLGPLVALALPAGSNVVVLHGQVAPLEVVVGGGAIGYLARLATKPDERRLRPAHLVFAAFVAGVGLSVFGPRGAAQLHGVLFWGALGIVFHAVTTRLDSRRNVRLLFVALVVPAVLETALAFFEYVDRWSTRFSRLHGAIVYPLPEGTLRHANALAMFLVFAALAIVALALAEKGRWRKVGFAAAGAASVALLVTFSRASWIALVLGACIFLLEQRARRPVLAGGVVVAGVGAVLALGTGGAIGQRISSLFTVESSGLSDFRVELWQRAADVTGAHPLTGAGSFEQAGIYAGRPDLVSHPHNLFLGLTVFFGIPAAVAFAALVGVALQASWRCFRRASGSRRLTALGLLAALTAVMVNGVFEYPFWNLSLTALIVLLLGVASTLADDAPGRESSSAG